MDFGGVEDDNIIKLPKECGIEDDESLNIDDKMLTLTK